MGSFEMEDSEYIKTERARDARIVRDRVIRCGVYGLVIYIVMAFIVAPILTHFGWPPGPLRFMAPFAAFMAFVGSNEILKGFRVPLYIGTMGIIGIHSLLVPAVTTTGGLDPTQLVIMYALMLASLPIWEVGASIQERRKAEQARRDQFTPKHSGQF
jgi:hypothetical protein